MGAIIYCIPFFLGSTTQCAPVVAFLIREYSPMPKKSWVVLLALIAACGRGEPTSVVSPPLTVAKDKAALTEGGGFVFHYLSLRVDSLPATVYGTDSQVVNIIYPGNYVYRLCDSTNVDPTPPLDSHISFEYLVNNALTYSVLANGTNCQTYTRSTTETSPGFTIFGKLRTDELTEGLLATTSPLMIVHNRILPSVSISGGIGDGQPISTGTFTWTASGGGTHPPFTYTWDRRNFCDQDYYTVGSGTSYTEQTFAGEESFYLRVTITDARGGTASAVDLVGHFDIC